MLGFTMNFLGSKFLFLFLIGSCIESNLNDKQPHSTKNIIFSSQNTFKKIKFSESATLNLTSEVEIHFKKTNDWPSGSLLVIQNIENDVLFYGVIKSKNDAQRINIAFNQKRLKLKVFDSIGGKLIVEKFIDIKNGSLRI
tara:strand:- start:4001 stop:4420 length:420 start_codon:yes stop_codon:yes gene_type:complete